MDLRFWKKRVESKSDAEELADFFLELRRISNPNLFQKVKNFLYHTVEEFLPYLFFVGVRAFAIWFSLQLALDYYGPQTPEWLIAIAFAQVWVGMSYIKLKQNRQAFIFTTLLCAVFSIRVMARGYHYSWFPVVLLLIVPFYFWLVRDEKL
ncbi:hypothetical protein [Acidithiobacillus ferrooxidans]|uniref:hypothetical protein n=1 Tax=Acidithiobacillus ferrooxidans TaxID=920 RepID=UPI0012BAC14B|nr:hypothetical protein [Acidithiobacillus ferrooxidans]